MVVATVEHSSYKMQNGLPINYAWTKRWKMLPVYQKLTKRQKLGTKCRMWQNIDTLQKFRNEILMKFEQEFVT